VFGLLVILYPGISVAVFVVFLSIWAAVIGLVQVVNAVQLRRRFQYWWLTLLYGVLALLFALVLFVNPFGGVLALTIFISFFIMAYGLLLLFSAFGMRAMHRLGQQSTKLPLP
jgi:uncharacterized membrane protein HdeD (DUF308 family)